jgi:hypothetical protein
MAWMYTLGCPESRDDYARYFPSGDLRTGRAAGGAKYQISAAGGEAPMWRREGKELFYISADRKLTAVPITLGSTVVAGSPQPLFTFEDLKKVVALQAYLNDDHEGDRVPELPIAFVPTIIDTRMLGQRSYFTLHGSDSRGLEVIPRLRPLIRQGYLRKVVLNLGPDDIRRMRMTLSTCGISEITAFPDISGLGSGRLLAISPAFELCGGRTSFPKSELGSIRSWTGVVGP